MSRGALKAPPPSLFRLRYTVIHYSISTDTFWITLYTQLGACQPDLPLWGGCTAQPFPPRSPWIPRKHLNDTYSARSLSTRLPSVRGLYCPTIPSPITMDTTDTIWITLTLLGACRPDFPLWGGCTAPPSPPRSPWIPRIPFKLHLLC